jgi:aromatic-L-amino-acid decarboxylase
MSGSPPPAPAHRPLSLSDAEIERAGKLLVELLADYERSIRAASVVPALDDGVLTGLLSEPFPDHGVGVDGLFAQVREQVVPNSTVVSHPRFLAYVLGPPTGIGPFAEAIAATLNQNCNFAQLSPAACVIERAVVSWLASLFGCPETAGGLMLSGGSMASLTALSAAINRSCGPSFRRGGLQSLPQPLTIYVSEQAHRCVEKDAAILGLGLDHVRRIPVDEGYRMRVDALDAAIEADRRAGFRPVCVVATAGTVATGAVDPIDALADLCAAQGLWLHVDGAYGALFVLSPDRAELLRECGRADSIALDPHKLLSAPLEAGCLIVRDPQTLSDAFCFSSPYLTGSDDNGLFIDYMDYGPQLSRSFKAFKVWCGLRVFGVEAFRQAASRMLALAQRLEARLAAEPAFELLAPVTLSAVCFRLRDGDEAAARRLLERLTAEGTALLGPVSLNGAFGLRACIANYRTTEQDIDLLVDRLVALAGEVMR